MHDSFINKLQMTCYRIPDGDSMSSWCGWHTDHGSLTGWYHMSSTSNIIQRNINFLDPLLFLIKGIREVHGYHFRNINGYLE